MDDLTPHEYRILRAYAQYENEVRTAEQLGMRLQTIKNAKTIAFHKLGVSNAIGAFKKMGWLSVPEETT